MNLTMASSWSITSAMERTRIRESLEIYLE